jgi:hypothetical protein
VTEQTIDLDQHRGMAAQKTTDLRRLMADVEANERALRSRQDKLEITRLRRRRGIGPKPPRRRDICSIFLPLPSPPKIPVKQKLIAAVLDDFERLRRG